jgi:CubicO group peptidase (beta-lactamase class C family)
MVAPRVDIPMTAAGGLWASAADLARFLEFQLGDGTVDGRTVLDAALMEEMRTVPAPDAGAPAGYALGVARTRWRAGQYLDLFSHGGGGDGFLSDLWWLPQLQLGIAVLTNSSEHDLQGTLALGILRDLVTEPDSRPHHRMLGLPTQSDVVDPTTSTWHRRTWLTGSRPSRCRRPASSPPAGPDTPSGTAPDSSAP